MIPMDLESTTTLTAAQHTFTILCALPFFDIHVQRLTTLYDDDKRPSYHVSHDTFFKPNTLLQPTFLWTSIHHFLPTAIHNPIPSKLHPLSSSAASAFSVEKMGYSLTMWGGAGRRSGRIPVGSFGHQKIERKIPRREGIEDSRLT